MKTQNSKVCRWRTLIPPKDSKATGPIFNVLSKLNFCAQEECILKV